MVEELRGLGKLVWSRTLLACGQYSAVQDCQDCGTEAASVATAVSCGQRLCGFCSRRAAGEQGARVDRALRRVLAELETLVPEARARLRAEDERQKIVIKGLDARIVEWTAQGGKDAQVERAVERRRLSEARRVSAARRGAILGARLSAWGLRLVTISPRWDPSDPETLTVRGLRRRIDDCWARWQRLLEAGLDLGGALAATARIEISPGGHVHLHAVAVLPHVSKKWLMRAAGCFVDVRRGDRSVVREAVKYAVKSPSPLSQSWIAGEVKAGLIHPRLAARFQVAMYGRKSLRHYGPLLRALKVDREKDRPTAEADVASPSCEPQCRSCRSPNLSAPRAMSTAELAARLGPAWSAMIRLGLGSRSLLAASRSGDRVSDRDDPLPDCARPAEAERAP